MHFRIFALICLSVLSHVSATLAQSSAFTYQGRLQTNGVPYTGSAEFQFTLWDAASAGTTIAANNPATIIASVDSGLFTVTLDFGAAAFDGQPRFLQIDARTALGAFTTLSPRQPLGSTPYALRALNSAIAANVSGNVPVAQITGTVPLSQLPTSVITNGATDITLFGTFSGNGSGLTGLNASQLTAGIVPSPALSNAWQVGGNTGTTPESHFLGTTDNSPLEIRANNLRAFRIEPTAGGPNLIGGSANNSIGAFTEFATISGGRLNQIGTNSDGSVIAGGGPNSIGTNASSATIGGGVGNSIGNFTDSAVIVGGFENAIGTNLMAATIAGGAANAIESGAGYSIVAGGSGNRVATDVQNAFVAGTSAHALHQGSFVWADASAPSTPFGSTKAHQFNARATGGVRFETDGAGMTVDGQNVVAGPVGTAQIANSAITVGKLAASAVTQAKIADSAVNSAKIADGTIQAADVDAATFDTTFWRAGGNSGTTAGTHFLGTTDNQALELRVNNRAALRLQPNPGTANVVGGHPDNSIGAGLTGAFIGGGGAAAESRNRASSNYTAVVGGYGNSADGNASFVGGGAANSIAADSHAAVVVGGSANNVREGSAQAIIGGGNFNSVSNASPFATVAGGAFNLIGQQSLATFIGGGSLNVIGDLSRAASVAGGEGNQIGANSPGSAVGGGRINVIAANTPDTTISGGTRNRIGTNSVASTISGGGNNEVSSNALASVIGGGSFNTVGYASTHSTIAGGGANSIGTNSFGSTIGGGSGNRISTNSQHATIAGGRDHRIGTNAAFSVIGGGYGNTNFGLYATVSGGTMNFASGDFSQAAGYRAKAIHDGAFVWADSQGDDFASTLANQVRLRAAGGMEVVGGSTVETLKFSATRAGDFSSPVGLALNNNNSGNSAPAMRVVNLGGNSVDGALSVSSGGSGFIAKFGNSSAFVSSLAVNGTWSALAFNPTSDRAAKENFTTVDAREVLEKVAALPLTRWTYKAAPGVEHIGPVAQDFHAAFGLNGEDDKHIATVDADGVALAAIQGLNQKVEAELRAKEARIEALEKQLADLKELLTKAK